MTILRYIARIEYAFDTYSRLDASYTVEAAWIIAVSLLLIGSGILLGFDVFEQATAYILKGAESVDSVQLFRLTSTMKTLLNK